MAIVNEVITKIKYVVDDNELDAVIPKTERLDANTNKVTASIKKQDIVTKNAVAELKKMYAQDPSVLIGKLQRIEAEEQRLIAQTKELKASIQTALAGGNVGLASDLAKANKVVSAQIKDYQKQKQILSQAGVRSVAPKSSAISSTASGVGSAVLGGVIGGGVSALALQGVAEAKQFLTDSKQAAKEAESNFSILKESLQGNVEEATRLADAASQLQNKSVFNDDDIINGNKLLVGVGATTDKIIEYNDAIAKSAVVTRNSFEGQSVLIEGIARGQDRGIKSLKLTKDAQDELKASLKGVSDPAQRLDKIMSALSKQFGNVDAAMTGTAQGAALRYENAMDSVKEKTGEFLNKLSEPVVNKIAEALSNPETLEAIDNFGDVLLDIFGGVTEVTSVLWGQIQTLWNELSELVRQLGFSVDVSGLFKQALNAVVLPLELVLKGIIAIVNAAREIVAVFGGLSSVFTTFKTDTVALFSGIGDSLSDIFTAIFNLDYSGIEAGVERLKNSFTGYGSDIKNSFVRGYNANKNGISVAAGVNDVQDQGKASLGTSSKKGSVSSSIESDASEQSNATEKVRAKATQKTIDFYKKELDALEKKNRDEDILIQEQYNKERAALDGNQEKIKELDDKYARDSLSRERLRLEAILELQTKFKKDLGSTRQALTELDLELIKLDEKDKEKVSKDVIEKWEAAKKAAEDFIANDSSIDPITVDGAIEVTGEISPQTVEEIKKSISDKIQEINKFVNESAPLINEGVSIVGDLLTSITQSKINDLDNALSEIESRIDAQQERVTRAKEFILTGGAENYEKELEALKKLQSQEASAAKQKEEQEKKLLKQQQALAKIEAGIAFTVATANAVAAVAKAAAQGGVLAPATIALVLAAIGSGVALAKTLFLADGGEVQLGKNKKGIDTVPAMLTAGEFVVKKNTVDKLGMPFMKMLNSGKIDPTKILSRQPVLNLSTVAPQSYIQQGDIAKLIGKAVSDAIGSLPLVQLGDKAVQSGLVIQSKPVKAADFKRKKLIN